jgi:type IV pilus assembly protein PilC
MLNPSKRSEIQTLLARQLAHLTRAGDSYETAFQKLHDAADGELRDEVEGLRRYLAADQPSDRTGRHFATPMATLARLAAIARRHGANPEGILSRAEDVFGPLGESYRVYWAGIAAFLWYALMLLVMVFAVLVIFSIFVFPSLAELFEGQEAAMPGLTLFMISSLQPLMGLFFFLAAAGVVVLGIAAYKLRDAMKRLAPLRGVMTRTPGLASLCESYNEAILLNLSRLLTYSGMVAEDALDEVSRMQRPDKAAFFKETSVTAGELDGMLRTAGITGALELARRTGTLGEELEHLSAQAQSIFAYRLAKIREEFTLMAQVTVGIVIGTLVVGMYLPIFKLGTIF